MAGPTLPPDCGATVLTHPRFATEPVCNPRVRGKKAGTYPIQTARRMRRLRAEAAEADTSRSRARPFDAILDQPIATAASAEQRAQESTIQMALDVLVARLRVPGQLLSSPAAMKTFVALRLGAREEEVFGVAFLDSQLRLLAWDEMFNGTLAQCGVYPREVARRALKYNADSVILCHCHPSGNPEPSKADRVLTDCLRTSLQLIGVRVHDHLVVGGAEVASMRELGWMD